MSNIDKIVERAKKHHVWCNNAFSCEASECKMCKGLFEKYPVNGMNENELMWKHFPKVAKENDVSRR